MNTWDVVTLRYPFTDGSGMKQRPALVVSKNQYHEYGEDGLFLLITSNVDRRAFYDVLIPSNHPEFAWTGLHKESCIRVDKIMNLKKDLVCRRLGNIGDLLKQEVRSKLKELWTI